LQQENYRGLRESIDAFKQFDQIALAQSLERHELMEFRRIAAYLYKMNKRWDQSIEISKRDTLWKDAMETTAESGDQKSAEGLLTFFVESKLNECFAACLFTCYELIRPDVVLELAWRNQLMNFAMPFMIQCFRDFDEKVAGINNRLEAADKLKAAEEAKKNEIEQNNQQNDLNGGTLLLTGPSTGMVPPMMPPMGGMGGGMGLAPLGGMAPMGNMGGGYPPMGGLPPMMPQQGFGPPAMGGFFQ
jgi:clathrin heavy chain